MSRVSRIGRRRPTPETRRLALHAPAPARPNFPRSPPTTCFDTSPNLINDEAVILGHAPIARQFCFASAPRKVDRRRCRFTFPRVRKPDDIVTKVRRQIRCGVLPFEASCPARRRAGSCRASRFHQRRWADRNGFVEQLSSSAGKAMTRLHGSFSYERRPQSKPVASTIFPLALRANSSRKTKLPPLRVRRCALASRRRRRFGSIGSYGAHHGKPSQTGHRPNDGELR